jgi:UbiD family decarboxylase
VAEDLRQWLQEVEGLGELRRLNGVDWNLELGAITALNAGRRDCPALLFDHIKDYPEGFRVLTCSTSSPRLVGLTLKVGTGYNDLELIGAVRERLPLWQAKWNEYPSREVKEGPILENVKSGKEIDLFAFPVPMWNELDGGRYIGTGDAVITGDPDEGWINLGTYRVMVHDERTTGILIVPGQHGRGHVQKYHDQGRPCPIAVSVGHHPLIFRAASIEVPAGVEYQFMGAIRDEPIEVIREEVTGLPIPADSEMVLVGWCPPGKLRDEGPFGEWTGYYSSGKEPAPIIEVERVYYRDRPVILGSPPNKAPCDSSYFGVLLRSAMLHNDLEHMGVPDVKGVWISEIAGRQFITVSIKQRYAGHAKQAALLTTQSRIGSNMGRYVIVVDEDIDPTNMEDVFWALCTRSDPEKDLDIIRRCRSNSLDPVIRRPAEAYSNSRAILDACRPFAWIEEFPRPVQVSDELKERVRRKVGHRLELPEVS